MAAETDTIIAVDLDGTLTLTDTLYESVVLLLRERPLQVLALPFWLMTGKAALKAKLADRVTVKAKLLPYNIMLIEWLRKQKATGRKLVLCTAADQHTAQSVADHLQFFDYVFASDGKLNLAGENKRQVL